MQIFIHINGNVCINNCRRIKLKNWYLEGQRIVTPRPGGILIFGQDILITNNQCCDSIVPSTKATQLYGLVIHPFSKNIIIGSNAICSNFLIGPPEGGGDIFDERPDPDNTAPDKRLKSYNDYLLKIQEIQPL